MQYHKYSLTEVENLIPWERDIYVTLLQQHLEEEQEKAKALMDSNQTGQKISRREVDGWCSSSSLGNLGQGGRGKPTVGNL